MLPFVIRNKSYKGPNAGFARAKSAKAGDLDRHEPGRLKASSPTWMTGGTLRDCADLGTTKTQIESLAGQRCLVLKRGTCGGLAWAQIEKVEYKLSHLSLHSTPDPS